MIKIYFYQAECGDAARLRFIGKDNKPHNIFIDSGYERTFRHVLAGEIQDIIRQGEVIDLWVISHIHDDHIGGVIRFIKTINAGEFSDIVQKWLYNLPRPSLNQVTPKKGSLISEPKSIDQGDILANYLAVKNHVPSDITNELSQIDIAGLKLIILSPDENSLQRLRDKYLAGDGISLERNEMDSISGARSAPDFDYNIAMDAFNLSQWNEDNSPENASSISFITEYDHKRVLWLADSKPSIIVRALRNKGYSEENRIACDWVKVAHHGSAGNNSDELYNLINCTNYFFSSNGENQHCLPNKECLVRILKNRFRNNAFYHFYFPYDNATLRNIFLEDGSDVFEKYNFTIHYLKEGKVLLQ